MGLAIGAAIARLDAVAQNPAITEASVAAVREAVTATTKALADLPDLPALAGLRTEALRSAGDVGFVAAHGEEALRQLGGNGVTRLFDAGQVATLQQHAEVMRQLVPTGSADAAPVAAVGAALAPETKLATLIDETRGLQTDVLAGSRVWDPLETIDDARAFAKQETADGLQSALGLVHSGDEFHVHQLGRADAYTPIEQGALLDLTSGNRQRLERTPAGQGLVEIIQGSQTLR